MHTKNKHTLKFLGVVLALLVSFCFILDRADAYKCSPNDVECNAAYENMNKKQNEANEAIAKANSITELIASIDAEIANINAKIAENENEIVILNEKITIAEEKLLSEQKALSALRRNAYFEKNDEPIRILASSKSISDFAEQEARRATAKKEVAIMYERVKNTREELRVAKNDVEVKLESNRINRTLAENKRADQEQLRQSYAAAADEASVLADYYRDEFQRLAYVPPSDTTDWGYRNYNAVNTYDQRGICPYSNMAFSTWYGGAVCQCTSYASYKAYERWGVGGDAPNKWLGHASNYINANGYRVPSTGGTTYVDRSPAPETIAVDITGDYGHVMWVESVNEDGSINVTEYNVSWPAGDCYAGDFCSRNNVGSKGFYFVHFE